MGKKVIVVTGANKGIGLAIVETLLQQLPEAVVLLGSRDASRGWSAFFLFHRRFLSKMERLLHIPFTALSPWFRQRSGRCGFCGWEAWVRRGGEGEAPPA